MEITRQKYKRIFDIIRKELNKTDPMGLAPGEFCPIDEYDSETEMIIAKIKNGIEYRELAENISLIFTEMFDVNFSKNMFYDCAENILEKVRSL